MDTSTTALPNTPVVMQCSTRPRIAVLIPCYNEAVTIGAVVHDFHVAVPEAVIYVYDNNSTDGTEAAAAAAGALVRRETRQGKGNVVRRAFADVDADVYVLVDGDGTYDAGAAQAMIAMLLEQKLDMVNAAREGVAAAAYRHGHRLGNQILTGIVAAVFGRQITDMLSGYRVFSRRFVKSFPALSAGFETETEFTIHALELSMPIGEVVAQYFERPPGSASNLRTVRDGMRILRTIVVLVKEERPLAFFGLAAMALLLLGLAFGSGVVTEFMRTGLVPRLPTAILASALVLLAALSSACGLILDSVARGRKEMKRMAYLAIPVFDRPENLRCARNCDCL
jgi:hypothetical protein